MIQSFVKSQNDYSGLYINSESNEFICFYNDTVQFRLYNSDAFGTYSLGKGQYKIDSKGAMYLQCNTIIKETSIVKKCSRKDDGLVIRVYGSNGMPMKFVTIKITKNREGNYYIVTSSDEYGKLSLNEEQINSLNSEKVFVYIETVGFVSEQEVLLEVGYDYAIKSKIPEKFPFTLVHKTDKFKINQLNSQSIEIEIGKYMKSELKRLDVDFQCSTFLFDKDISDF